MMNGRSIVVVISESFSKNEVLDPACNLDAELQNGRCNDYQISEQVIMYQPE